MRLILGVLGLGVAGWGVLALLYGGPGPLALRAGLAALVAALVLVALLALARGRGSWADAILAGLSIALLFW